MKSSFDSLVQFLLCFPRLPIALIFGLKQQISKLIAKVFSNPPNQESQHRKLEAGGEVRVFGIVRVAGCIKWSSIDRTKRLKLLRRKALRHF